LEGNPLTKPAQDGPRTVPATQATGAFEGPLANELDDLFKQLDGFSAELNSKAPAPAASGEAVNPAAPAAAPATVPASAMHAVESADTVAKTAEAKVGTEHHEASTTHAERDALDVGLQTAPSAKSALEDDQADLESDQVPSFLLPLVWLSAPLAAAPKWVRDLIGQLAIMTTLNAVAVLIYVFVFRKH
jgi:hypothetical protein